MFASVSPGLYNMTEYCSTLSVCGPARGKAWSSYWILLIVSPVIALCETVILRKPSYFAFVPGKKDLQQELRICMGAQIHAGVLQ